MRGSIRRPGAGRLFVRGLVLTAAFVFLSTPVASVLTRQDDASAPYLEGFLTWEDAGLLRWSSPSSEDFGGPGTDFSDDEYRSAPVPAELHLNASRFVEVDLFVKGLTSTEREWQAGNVCLDDNHWRVELYADDVFVGGALDNQAFRTTRPGATSWGNPDDGRADFPPDPPGYGVCRFRISPETAVIPEGAIVRLRIVHGEGSPSATYGMGGDHASVVRFPYYAPDEVIFRYPSVLPGAQDSGASKNGPDIGSLLMGAGPASAMLLAVRRNRRAALVLLCVAGLLAGCLGGGSTRSGESDGGQDFLRETLEPVYQEGNLSEEGFGTLAGQVFDAQTLVPLARANLALIGSSGSAITDKYGRFVIREIAPGGYVVRADLAAYRSFEAEVDVAANVVTRVEIPLQPADASALSGRAHRHDYWGGKNEITLLDRQTFAGSETFAIEPQEGAFHTILPGTYEINVTLEWESGSQGPLQLMFMANHDASFHNRSQMYPRGSGESFHVVTNWEMTDAGHQRFSSWTFWVIPQSGGPQFLLTVKIKKGTVPLEPAHPDLWGAANVTRPLAPTLRSAQPQSFPPFGALYPVQGANPAWNTAWLPSGLVPPETRFLEVRANLTRGQSLPYPLELRYKTAETPTSALCFEWHDSTSPGYCNGANYHRVAPTIREAASARWVIAVGPDASDAYYMVRSSWVFGVSPASTVEANTAAAADYRTTPTNPLRVELSVSACRCDGFP